MAPPNVTPVKGVHRVSLDLPIDTWNEILQLAAKAGMKPISYLRQLVSETVERRSKK